VLTHANTLPPKRLNYEAPWSKYAPANCPSGPTANPTNDVSGSLQSSCTSNARPLEAPRGNVEQPPVPRLKHHPVGGTPNRPRVKPPPIDASSQVHRRSTNGGKDVKEIRHLHEYRDGLYSPPIALSLFMCPRFARFLSCNAYISVVVCRYALGGGVCAFAGVAFGA